MKNKFIPFLIFCTMSVNMYGCGANEEQDKNGILLEDKSIVHYNFSAYQNGLIYIDNDSAYFLDYDSFTGIPLCNKPDCTHSDISCVANIVVNGGKNMSPPVVSHDYVYYFTSSDEIIEGENGTEDAISCTCSRISLSTGKGEKVAEFDGMEATNSDDIVIYDNKMFFIAHNGSIQSESGSWYYISSAGSQYLCSIDFETGDFQNYGLVNDNEYAKNSLFTVGESAFGILGSVEILGLYQDNLYMYYRYVEDSDILYQYYQDNGGSPDPDDSEIWNYEVRVFDFETQELSNSELPRAVCVNDGIYLYWDEESSNYVALNADGTETVLNDFQKSWNPQIANGKVWSFGPTCQTYDLSTNSIKAVTNDTYASETTSICDYYENQYIVQYYNSTEDAMAFAAVTEDVLIGD